jgi:hypothetical protein
VVLLGAGKNLLVSLPRRLRQRAFARRRAIGQGEAASTALRVRSRDEIAHHVRRSRCACGVRSIAPLPEPEMGEVLFGGRSLTSARMTCPVCGRSRSLFFDVSG